MLSANAAGMCKITQRKILRKRGLIMTDVDALAFMTGSWVIVEHVSSSFQCTLNHR